MNFRLLYLFFILFPLLCKAQASEDKATISGYIKDNSNGESLIGATVYIQELGTGAVTNVYGFYSLTLAKGSYTMRFTYVGFQSQTENISLTENTRLDISLDPEGKILEEIVVEGEEDQANVENIEMSTNNIRASTIRKMPSFLGEADVVKSILMLPGVSTVGDGASGFNVRGGSVGQNMVLLDEAPVYNSSHLFGFFSVFNPDAVKDVKLYKGGVPARYGGRIASVLDVRMKEGNNKKLAFNGGVGLIFAKFAIEAPIVKNKSSFIVAARRSYFDIFTSLLVPGLRNAALNFYDVTLKANYTLNEKNKLYLSGYLGQDNFKFDGEDGFNWGNITSTLRWNHLYSNRLFSNTTFVYSLYNYQLQFSSEVEGEPDLRSGINWKSSISNFALKPQFTYFLNSKSEIDFGVDMTYYFFKPADAVVASGTRDIDIGSEDKYNLEASVYASNKHKISPVISLEYGLRFTGFWAFGPGTVYRYGDAPELGLRRPLESSKRYSAGEVESSYNNIEPRISFKVQTGKNSSIKGSYNRTTQYLHLISNTAAANPLNVWVPSSSNIKPEIGDQFTLGHFRNLGKKKEFEVSVEGYYRETQNEIGYIDGADILLNEFLEGDLLSGKGRAYGAEFFFQKKKGRLSGWVSYTLARTELQVNGINNGDWYPTRYDQTHNLKIAAFYEISDRVSVSSNFTFISGAPSTFPNVKYRIGDRVIYHNTQNSRNNIRIPHYSRWDVAVRIEGKKVNRRGKVRKLISYWEVGVYNIYARQNPFDVSFFESRQRPGLAKATQLSVLGFVIPSVSWNFKFAN